MTIKRPTRLSGSLFLLGLLLWPGAELEARKKGKQKTDEDRYAEFVWPPPPDKARIKLEAVIHERADVEARTRLRRKLIGSSPRQIYDRLRKPYAVAFDGRGRILVTDWGTAAIIRYDRDEGKMDVLGTRGALRLKQPLGISVGPDDSIFVADPGLGRVVRFDPEGKLLAAYGREGDLVNPVDAVVAPDGERLFVADSKAHRILVFDLATGDIRASFGEKGSAEGQFAFPTSLAFGPAENLYVVDQINGRVQVFDGQGDFLDTFGELGVGFGAFARPKGVAVDEVGLIYVTDNAFN
ncbi:MAG: hypothetical protein ACE5EG_02520, partial [Thermoanaerobaculia bacterium]